MWCTLLLVTRVCADSMSTGIFCDISIIVCIFRIFMQAGSSH